MFKKLLAKLRPPKKHGENAPEVGGQRWVKTYDLILSNMEGSPAYPLSHQLTVGSEIGNIIINDSSVSPRHATILLQEDVISIMDHGSFAGTFVNGTKIPAGKFIILEDSDNIRVGDLEIKFGIKTKAIEDSATVPPDHDQLDEEVEADTEEDTEEVEDEAGEEEGEEEVESRSEKEVTLTKSKAYMQAPPQAKPSVKPATKKKSKISFSLPSYDAANSVVRVMAVSADLLLSYIILIVFYPFDDFRNFLNYLPQVIEEALDFKWQNIWITATEEAGQVTDVLSGLYSIVNEVIPVLHVVLVFFMLRLLTTILFGVSIAEFMFGIRANFNRIWARIGGILRVIVGMVTWPLVIFDLPSLVSKRTFKEFITFTNVYVGSRVTMFFGIVFYAPLLVVLLLISPMFIGLELVEPIPFSAVVSQRVKPKASGDAAEVQSAEVGGKYLGVSLKYDPQKLSLIPTFKFKGEKAKLNMNAALDFYNRETERDVVLELYKTFDLKELLKIGLSGNLFLHEQFPKIYNYAYSVQNTNRFFKKPENPAKEEAFGREVVEFTSMAFGLSVDGLPDFMMTKTPLLKSVVDFRGSLLALFDYKDFTDLSVIKIGKTLCLRATYDKQKPFDLVLPLMRGEGRLYKVTYDKKEGLQQNRNDFYKFGLDGLTWGIPEPRGTTESYNALEVLDLFTTDIEKGLLNPEKGQALYGFYFEKSAEVLKAGKLGEYEIWKAAVQSFMNVIPYLKVPVVKAQDTALEPSAENPDATEDVKAKLKSNFLDLFNALENKNMNFFGIEESPTV